MSGGRRIFLFALVLSLLAHLVVASSSSHWWTTPAREIPFPIEAHLQPLPTPVKQVAATTRPPPRTASVKPAPSPIADSAPNPETKPVVLAQAPAEVMPIKQLPEPATVEPEPAPEPAATSASEPVLSEPTTLPETAPRVLRSLPQQIALRYSVQSGEDGFLLGYSTYSGWMRDGRYSLNSITEATGVTALFVSGKIIQRSEGSIGAEGLQPEKFWGEKGSRIQIPVRFDRQQHLLMLPGGSVELQAQTQDLLSFPFHLAMRVQETDTEWMLPVTNGKKLRNYHFQVIGREVLAIAGSRVETLRLQGSRSGEGSLDVWLAAAQQWLPVKIRTLDQKGKVILLTLQANAD